MKMMHLNILLGNQMTDRIIRNKRFRGHHQNMLDVYQRFICTLNKLIFKDCEVSFVVNRVNLKELRRGPKNGKVKQVSTVRYEISTETPTRLPW